MTNEKSKDKDLLGQEGSSSQGQDKDDEDKRTVETGQSLADAIAERRERNKDK